MQVFATKPTRMIFSIPRWVSWASRSVLAKPCPQVLERNDIPGLGAELGMELSAPRSRGEAVALARANLGRAHVFFHPA